MQRFLTSRRTFVRQALAAAATAPFLRSRAAAASHPTPAAAGGPVAFPLESFDYEGVRLGDGPLRSQYLVMRDYYFRIADDDMLKGFRARAGLPAPGEELGGWYSGDPKRRTWWSAGDTFNTFGQWLSAMARMSRATGDTEMGRKAGNLMTEWGKAIEGNGYFFYSRRPWQPHYIYDKTVGGLVDMVRYGGRKDALPLLEKITDWASENLDRSRRVDSDTEWYTLSENLYRAYELTGDARYRNFGDVWRFTDYWRSFTGPSPVSRFNHHAYSHVNTLSSAAMTHAVTGEAEWLATIVNAYDWLQQTQCYATGGYGPEEDLVPPDGELGRRLDTTFRSFETPCGSWAGFKLSKYLMRFTGEARFGDWIERLLYNGILAALPMAPKGETFYYSDYRLGGARKIYHIDGEWPCCSGTYPQVVVDYHDVIYFKSAAGLAVNLFVPSRVTWNQDGREVSVEQITAFPETDTTTLTVTAATGRAAEFELKFRVPAWTRGVTVAVNGTAVRVPAVPGTWAAIRRDWASGDCVKIRLPMALTAVPVDRQHPDRVAVRYGPIVLVRPEPSSLTLSGPDLSRSIVRRGEVLEFELAAERRANLVPFYRIAGNTPYNMYFDRKI